jgi:hypothetical protein
MLTEDGKRLLLQAYRNDQLVFLVSDPNPMTCSRTADAYQRPCSER